MPRSFKIRRLSTKMLVASGALTAGLVAGGIAFATWTSNGVGSGGAGAVTAVNLTVTAATGTADLFPGTTQGDVYFTITNPNPYPVTFTSMSLGGAITNAVAGDATACPPANVTAVGATGLNLTVGANTTSATQSIANVVSMALAAPDGCQGKSFVIPLTLSGSSA
jgi:hypothetical protein